MPALLARFSKKYWYTLE